MNLSVRGEAGTGAGGTGRRRVKEGRRTWIYLRSWVLADASTLHYIMDIALRIHTCSSTIHNTPTACHGHPSRYTLSSTLERGGGGVYSYSMDTIEGPRAPAVKLTARHSSLTSPNPSGCTGSRLPVLTRTGGKRTLQSPKSLTAGALGPSIVSIEYE